MKKLLLVSTAIAGMALVSSPASAAINMDLGGFFRGYGMYTDNNEPSGSSSSLYEFEFRRDTEIHANGETTLDNGLTIGAHGELKIANGSNSTYADEIYAYASGGWGRVNFGLEDGAAYLLQVAAPSADSNIDGLRVNIQALNQNTGNFSDLLGSAGIFGAVTSISDGVVDYDHADFKSTDRLTYLTPKFDGFQAGISYAPKMGITSNLSGMSLDKDGFVVVDGGTIEDGSAQYKDLWEIGARYDGEFEGVAVALGAGYSDSSIEQEATAAFQDFNYNNDHPGDYGLDDGIKTWNGGASFGSNGFTLGGSYKHTETSYASDSEWSSGCGATPSSCDTSPEGGDITNETWVVGLGYDNGPWHAGASYLNNNFEFDGFTGDDWDMDARELETDKYTVGGGYTFGPGMTFRGSVAWGEFDDKSVGASADDDNDFTQVAVGADIQF